MIKDLMLQMLSMMMPYMIWVFRFGALVTVIGLVLLVLNLLNGSMSDKLQLAGKILLGVAAFYFACELAGMYLSAKPSHNFGDESKFEFIIVRFWKVGVAALVIGSFYLLMGKRGEHHTGA